MHREWRRDWRHGHCHTDHYLGERLIALTAYARAKINIGLKITGQREDGYHTLETIFQEISLTDEITLDIGVGESTFTSSDPSLPLDGTNLCMKAVKAVEREVDHELGVSVHLEKRIPVAAGLGGGSSDAAAVLKGLNTLFDLKLSPDRMKAVAVSLGADVPFFLDGGCQYATGIGDQLVPVTLPPIGVVLLVLPPERVSTKWAYGEVKNALSCGFSSGNFPAPLGSRISWDSAGVLFENDFESLVFQTYPEVGDLKRRLISAGADFASLSGSGSTVFGIFEDHVVAEHARQQFSTFQSYVAFPVTDSSDFH
ncbi:MAG: 4-(cytidine 5'-diphospho)-2-C-methyl-D-erythritol kinase [Candidatus Neomarinimicrobiota bacterium]|nr:4-(cytidine 5'-diphospho)-2-C-methyl-D-erythritol kinase [Candidatus Neomarinimicrobiota bacterium]